MFYKIVFIISLIISVSNASNDLKNINSFQATFEQQIISTNGKRINYNGNIFIKNDGKILWKYKTPILKNVYVLNDYVIVDEPELEQAIYTKLENEIDIVKILRSSKKIDKNTYITNIEDIQYKIEVKNRKIDNIAYVDKLDNKITIKFQNVVQNKQIKDELFKFIAPEYYDIIRK